MWQVELEDWFESFDLITFLFLTWGLFLSIYCYGLQKSHIANNFKSISERIRVGKNMA